MFSHYLFECFSAPSISSSGSPFMCMLVSLMVFHISLRLFSFVSFSFRLHNLYLHVCWFVLLPVSNLLRPYSEFFISVILLSISLGHKLPKVWSNWSGLLGRIRVLPGCEAYSISWAELREQLLWEVVELAVLWLSQPPHPNGPRALRVLCMCVQIVLLSRCYHQLLPPPSIDL